MKTTKMLSNTPKMSSIKFDKPEDFRSTIFEFPQTQNPYESTTRIVRHASSWSVKFVVFLFNNWVIAGDIDKHEEIMKKLIPHYKKIEELKSYRYFGHFAGQDLSAWGGRLEIFEFENHSALENFFKKFDKDKEGTNLLNNAMALTDHATVRFSLMSERNRDLWLERK